MSLLGDAMFSVLQDSVLPPDVTARVSLEAGSTFGWERYVGPKGIAIGIDEFGHSAPGEQVTWNLLLHVLAWSSLCLQLLARSGCLQLLARSGCLQLLARSGCLQLLARSGCLQLLARSGCTAVSRCSHLATGLPLPDLLCWVMLLFLPDGLCQIHSKRDLPCLLYTAAKLYMWCPATPSL